MNLKTALKNERIQEMLEEYAEDHSLDMIKSFNDLVVAMKFESETLNMISPKGKDFKIAYVNSDSTFVLVYNKTNILFFGTVEGVRYDTTYTQIKHRDKSIKNIRLDFTSNAAFVKWEMKGQTFFFDLK